MVIALSTSDYVAIASLAVQVVVTVAVAVWTVRKTMPASAKPVSVRRSAAHDLVLTWLKATWMFMVFAVVGVVVLTTLLTSDGPLDKEWVLRVVLAMFYVVCNVVGLVAALFYIVQQRINSGLLLIAERITVAPQDAVVRAVTKAELDA